jgi:hypothetical protein
MTSSGRHRSGLRAAARTPASATAGAGTASATVQRSESRNARYSAGLVVVHQVSASSNIDAENPLKASDVAAAVGEACALRPSAAASTSGASNAPRRSPEKVPTRIRRTPGPDA